MHRRPPRSTRTASLFPSPTLFRSVVELDAFIDLALLDRRVDQADDAGAVLFATFHGRLHVFDELGFESHGFGAGNEGNGGSEGNGWKTKGRLRLRVPAFGLPRAAGRAARPAQYRRWRLVTSRELRRAWRFTAAAALRLRSW